MENTKTYQIKCNGWHKVELTGNVMTGDTYPVREWIKKNLNGKWYAPRSGWIVDLDKVEQYTCGSNNDTLMVH